MFQQRRASLLHHTGPNGQDISPTFLTQVIRISLKLHCSPWVMSLSCSYSFCSALISCILAETWRDNATVGTRVRKRPEIDLWCWCGHSNSPCNRLQNPLNTESKQQQQPCYGCGNTDHFGKDSECPARGQKDHKCNGYDCFSKVCRTKNTKKQSVFNEEDKTDYIFVVMGNKLTT